MSYTIIALLALLVHIIINHDVIRNKHYRHETVSAVSFRWLILSIGAFYVTDALWGVLYDARLITAVFIDTTVYFVAMAFTVFFWSRYVIHYLNEKNFYLSMLSVVGWVFLGAMAVALVLNVFLPVMFWFDAEGAYHAADLRYAALAAQVLMFLGSSIYVLVRLGTRTASIRRRHIATGAFGIVMSVMVVLQVLLPLEPMYSMGCLLGVCILHSFVLGDIMEDRRRELEEHIRREKEQKIELGSARYMAYTDQLTGVKNTHAYVEAEKKVDERITAGELKDFGLIVFDLNELKITNDTRGHEAGDQLIQDACRLICRKFKHSPVYRIGGDEFVVMLEGDDFEHRKSLLAEFDTQIEENQKRGAVVVASGLAIYRPGQDNSYRRIFERADQRMYDRKGTLKAAME